MRKSELTREKIRLIWEVMGITVTMGEKMAGDIFQLSFIAGCGIIALIIAVIVVRKRTMLDR